MQRISKTEPRSDDPCTTTATGACCTVEETCSILSRGDCINAEGTYKGDDTTCDPDPCVVVEATGACCAEFAGIGCIDDTALDACLALAGAYFGDRSVCVDISCDTTVTLGACCVDEICSLVTSTTCSDASGTYQGNNTFCSSNTCDP